MANPEPMAPANDSATASTDAGSQFVIAGYRPVTHKERLDLIATLPMRPRRPCVQKPCNIGLFDEVSRNQLELF